jgi:hypothetical protein
MLANAIYFILMSNLEKLEGTDALTARGLSLDYLGRGAWGFVPIHTQEQWQEVFMMLIDAVDTERNTEIDRCLCRIECPPLALREALR